MANPIARYAHWLHTMWPAGTVEKLPDTREDGTTALPGVRIVGDLTGIPLLKFSSDTGARAVQGILAEPDFAGSRGQGEDVLDLAIIGAGVSGVAAAIEANFPILRTGWIRWTLIAFTISGIAFVARVAPLQRRLRALGDAGAKSGAFDYAAYHHLARQWEFWGAVALLTPLAGLVLMVLKPIL